MLDAAAFASNQPQQSSPVNSDLELLMLKTTAQQSAQSIGLPKWAPQFQMIFSLPFLQFAFDFMSFSFLCRRGQPSSDSRWMSWQTCILPAKWSETMPMLSGSERADDVGEGCIMSCGESRCRLRA